MTRLHAALMHGTMDSAVGSTLTYRIVLKAFVILLLMRPRALVLLADFSLGLLAQPLHSFSASSHISSLSHLHMTICLACTIRTWCPLCLGHPHRLFRCTGMGYQQKQYHGSFWVSLRYNFRFQGTEEAPSRFYKIPVLINSSVVIT